MKKQYLPQSVYNVWIATALAQVALNLYHAVTTLPGYRPTHLVAILVHLGLAGFWLVQRRKAQAYVAPAVHATVAPPSERSARGIFWFSVAFAVLFEAFAICTTVDYLRINAQYNVPLTIGGALSQLGMHLMFASMSYGIVAVSRQALLDARLTENVSVLEEEQTCAATQIPHSTWWTQDETRQEIKRR